MSESRRLSGCVVGPGLELHLVGIAVPVGVEQARVGADQLLLAVVQLVPVPIEVGPLQAEAGLRQVHPQRVQVDGGEQHLDHVGQAVAVRVGQRGVGVRARLVILAPDVQLAPAAKEIAAGARQDLGVALLLAVGQAVGVGVGHDLAAEGFYVGVGCQEGFLDEYVLGGVEVQAP